MAKKKSAKKQKHEELRQLIAEGMSGFPEHRKKALALLDAL